MSPQGRHTTQHNGYHNSTLLEVLHAFLLSNSTIHSSEEEPQGTVGAQVESRVGSATNPFPNLSLVSMGQDVYVRLQGAGFDDHLVPGE